MINQDDTLKVIKKRPKRTFSFEDKKRFYLLWKESGLKRNRFCKNHDLGLSTFTKWCRVLDSKKEILPSQNDWVPVVSKNKTLETGKGSMIIEIKVPNTMKIFIFLLFLIAFLREFFNAINIIW